MLIRRYGCVHYNATHKGAIKRVLAQLGASAGTLEYFRIERDGSVIGWKVAEPFGEQYAHHQWPAGTIAVEMRHGRVYLA